MHRPALTSGILFAALAVILGAFGAHALKAVLQPDQLVTFETGVRYQFYHSFALVFTGILYASFPFKQVKWATTCFLLGIVLFSGSLYALTLLKMNGEVGLGGVGILTPIGGVFFILGWLFLFMAVIKKK
jgi:uncharacterized membrane protein YgdD (TMEM256/DUF423 family)